MPFEDAANAFFKRGWFPLPLGLDSNGFPKKPMDDNWPHLPRTIEAIRSLRWGSAKGIGVALGPVSGNLAVIDIDDVDLGEAVYRRMVETGIQSRVIRTIRKRLHVYVTEETPSRSTAMTCLWKGTEIKIELKAQGTQVAAFPTPGYEVLINAEPGPVPSIADAWGGIARAFGIVPKDKNTANYPKPWQPNVPEGERNKAAYIEAHKLREAGIPLDQAKDLMRLRAEAFYQQEGLDLHEVLRTVESAYRKGVVEAKLGRSWGGVQ